eukprot:scaffold1693_cov188-Prasinococcus_capsulatus_cf.AAC.1
MPHFWKGLYHAKEEQWELAIQSMRKALQTAGNRDMWQVHYQLAAILEATHDYVAALRQLDEAIKTCFHNSILQMKYDIEQKLTKANMLGVADAFHGRVEVVPEYWEQGSMLRDIRAGTMAGKLKQLDDLNAIMKRQLKQQALLVATVKSLHTMPVCERGKEPTNINLLTNPFFENNIDAWNHYGRGFSIVSDPGPRPGGQ